MSKKSNRNEQEANMNQVDGVAKKRALPLEDVQTWRHQLVQGVLRAMAVVGGLAVAGALYDAYVGQALWQMPVLIGAYVLLVALTFWLRASYKIKSGMLLILLYGLGIFNLFIAGQTGDAFPFLLTVPLMAAIFFGRRMAMSTLVVTVLTLSAFAWAFVSGHIVIPEEQLSGVDDIGSWVSRGLVFLMLALLLVLPQNHLFQRLVAALTQSRELAEELKEQQASLETQVAERTADLDRRARYLQATAEVAREASSVLDLDELLSSVVTLVSGQFGFYHTGIFLLDPAGEWAVLQAASSEGGERMLARGHRLRVGQEGIVGYVTGRGEPRIALDVGTDAVHFDNPDLPETRSEMALLLRARGEIIGALDVQSTEPQAFSQEDVAVLQTLADQVAMAISNARLFQQSQESLESERKAYGEVSRRAWRELLSSQPGLAYLSNQRGISSLADGWRPEMETALITGQRVQGETTAASLAMPVKVRGQVIGVVGGRKPQDAGEWTAEEIALVEALTDQLSVAVESARLYQDVQRTAARERLTRQITEELHRATSTEGIVQTAVDTLFSALGTSRAFGKLEAAPTVRDPDKDEK